MYTNQRFVVSSPYGIPEVEVLLHLYLEIKSGFIRPFVQLRIMDLERNIKRLNWHQRHAVFLKGVCHMPSREIAALMEISHTKVMDHYNEGKANLIAGMNGA